MGENEPEEIKWITAVAAVSLLSPLYENVASAQQVLVNYAGAGLIRTHARRLTVKRVTTLEGINRTDDNIFVDSSFWEAFADGQRRASEDWGTGSFAANKFMNREWWQYRVFGVLFAENDIQQIPGVALSTPNPVLTVAKQENLPKSLAELLKALDPSNELLQVKQNSPRDVIIEKGKPVTASEVRIWFEGLSPTDQAQGIRWLWSAVKIAHPGRLLPRKLVEPLVEGRPKGRPRGN
jgi:hypothetical protein